eukprot:2665046-Prymnesium_polylepis.1
MQEVHVTHSARRLYNVRGSSRGPRPVMGRTAEGVDGLRAEEPRGSSSKHPAHGVVRAGAQHGGAAPGLHIGQANDNNHPRLRKVRLDLKVATLSEAVVNVPAVEAADRLEGARPQTVWRRPRASSARWCCVVTGDRVAKDALLGRVEREGAKKAAGVHVIGGKEGGIENRLQRSLQSHTSVGLAVGTASVASIVARCSRVSVVQSLWLRVGLRILCKLGRELLGKRSCQLDVTLLGEGGSQLELIWRVVVERQPEKLRCSTRYESAHNTLDAPAWRGNAPRPKLLAGAVHEQSGARINARSERD